MRAEFVVKASVFSLIEEIDILAGKQTGGAIELLLRSRFRRAAAGISFYACDNHGTLTIPGDAPAPYQGRDRQTDCSAHRAALRHRRNHSFSRLHPMRHLTRRRELLNR